MTGLEREFNIAYKKYIMVKTEELFAKPTDSYHKLCDIANLKLECDGIQAMLKTESLDLH